MGYLPEGVLGSPSGADVTTVATQETDAQRKKREEEERKRRLKMAEEAKQQAQEQQKQNLQNTVGVLARQVEQEQQPTVADKVVQGALYGTPPETPETHPPMANPGERGTPISPTAAAPQEAGKDWGKVVSTALLALGDKKGAPAQAIGGPGVRNTFNPAAYEQMMSGQFARQQAGNAIARPQGILGGR